MSFFNPRPNHNRMRRILLEKLKNTPEIAIFARYERQILENTTELHRMIPDLEISFTSHRIWKNAEIALEMHGARRIYFAPFEGDGMVEFVGIVTQIILHPDRYPHERIPNTLDFEEIENEPKVQEVNTMYSVTHCMPLLDDAFHFTEFRHFISGEALDKNSRQTFATVYK